MRLAIAFAGAMAMASALAGCAGNFDGAGLSPGSTAGQQAALPRGSCVGVVSAIGHSFTVKTIGLMVFGNEEKEVAIDSWGIENLMVSRVAAHVGPQVKVKRIAYPKEPLNSPRRPGLFSDNEGPLKARLQALSPSERCARYVAISRYEYEFTGTNQTVGGLGIVRRPSLITHSTFALHAMFALTLYEGPNLTRLRHRVAPSGEGPWMGVVRGPHVGIETANWPDPPEAAARSPRLRQATSELVSQSMDRTLANLRVLEGNQSGM